MEKFLSGLDFEDILVRDGGGNGAGKFLTFCLLFRGSCGSLDCVSFSLHHVHIEAHTPAGDAVTCPPLVAQTTNLLYVSSRSGPDTSGCWLGGERWIGWKARAARPFDRGHRTVEITFLIFFRPPHSRPHTLKKRRASDRPTRTRLHAPASTCAMFIGHLSENINLKPQSFPGLEPRTGPTPNSNARANHQ